MKEKDVLFLYDEIGKDMEIPMVREELAPYLAKKRQGEYTTDDYFSLPDEYRVELIDGVIYDMASPTLEHQILGDEIRTEISLYIRSKKGRCIAVTSPVDVQLDKDDKTIVQPDVMVICNRDILRKERVYGAPEFVVEVLSPSTRKKDIFIKLNKYRRAGVKEYWMVDSKNNQIIVYQFEKDNQPVIYPLESKVPVGIFNGECEIDFIEILERGNFAEE